MSAMLWMFAGVAFFLGMFALPLLGMFIGPILPPKYRTPLGSIWIKLAMITYDRALLVMRRDGSYQLLPSGYDAEKEAEVVHIDGEPRTFTDSHGLMGSLARRKLGVAIEEVSAVLNPAVVAVGAAQGRKLADGDGSMDAIPDGEFDDQKENLVEWLKNNPPSQIAEWVAERGDLLKAYWDTDAEGSEDRGQWVAAMNPYTRLKDSDAVVDMREVWNILEGSSDSDLAQRTQKRTLASQAKLHGGSQFKMAGMLAGAVILGWLLRDVTVGGGGGSESVISVPFTVVPPVVSFDLTAGLMAAMAVVV